MGEILLKRDPALKKLLDELPEGDPDAPMATVWSPWCEGKHEVPINRRISLDMGVWYGPAMAITEVIVYAEYQGNKGFGYIDPDPGSTLIVNGETLKVRIRVIIP